MLRLPVAAVLNQLLSVISVVLVVGVVRVGKVVAHHFLRWCSVCVVSGCVFEVGCPIWGWFVSYVIIQGCVVAGKWDRGGRDILIL